MDQIIEKLNYLINVLPIKVNQFSEKEFSAKPTDKWSKREILGHLCDSATNNHHRFIRIQFEKQPFVVFPYKQNDWVSIQEYQNMTTNEVVEFWITLNKQIVRIISKIPKEKLLYFCEVGDNKFITFSELIEDYMNHMDNHLIQIFGTSDL